MRAISLSTEPLAVSYALRQLVDTGELAVFSSGDKAAVLIPLEKYQALVDVLRWLEKPPERTPAKRARKVSAKRPRKKEVDTNSLPQQSEPATVANDLLSMLELQP